MFFWTVGITGERMSVKDEEIFEMSRFCGTNENHNRKKQLVVSDVSLYGNQHFLVTD